MLNLIHTIINYLTKIFNKDKYYSKTSYSQEGEDLILYNYLSHKNRGFYVDVGAFHPLRFSNTYLFYKKGWSGINIDATPGSMELFNKFRPRDVNLEVAISDRKQIKEYFVFDEPALNSLSRSLSKERDSKTKYKIKNVVKLKTKTLGEVLDKKMPRNVKIDFMSVDVEEHEYEVLKSNNWNKYKPSYLLIEVLKKEIGNFTKNKIYKFLENRNYSLIGITGRTMIFKNIEKEAK